MQVQVKLPGSLEQVAFGLQLSVFAVHSFTSVHVTPLPVYPVLQVHVKPPVVFWQAAFALQLSEFAVHSFTSVQTIPVPV